MAPLADVFVRVRVDKRAAERELREFKRDLRGMPNVVDVNIDVDIAKAMGEIQILKRELRDLQRQMEKRGGFKLATRIDTEGMQNLGASIGRLTTTLPALTGVAGLAAGALASLGASAVALASALAPAVGALAAFPALAGAAGQAAGTAAVSFLGVGDAVKALINVDKSAGATAQQQGLLRQQVAERVREAELALGNAVRQQQQISLAAQQRLSDAQRTARTAQQDLNDARRQAVIDLEDLNNQLKDAALSEEDAQIALERAQQHLRELQAGARTGSALDMREADLAVRQAAQRLVEIRQEHAQIKTEVEDANRKGVEGADNVVAAQQRVLDAQRAQTDAQSNAAQANADAARAVAEAQREVQVASDQTSARLDKQTSQQLALNYAMSQLSPAARTFARYLHGVVVEMTGAGSITWNAQQAFLPRLQFAMESLRPLLPIVNRAMTDTAGILGNLAIRGAGLMASGPWQRDFATLLTNNNHLLDVFGDIILNLAQAFMDVSVAAVPLANHIADFALNLSRSIAGFTAAQRASGGLTRFFEATWDVLQRLGRITGNLLHVFVNLGKAGHDAGMTLLDSIEGVTRKWKDWTGSVEGQNALRDYFNNAAKTAQAMGRLLGHIALGIAKLGANPNLAKLIDQLNEKLVPAFGDLFRAVSGDVGKQLIDFMTNLVRLLGDLTDGGGSLSAFVGTLNGMVSTMRTLLGLPVVGSGLEFFLKFLGASAAILLVGGYLGRMASAFGRLGEIVGGLAHGLGLFGRATSIFRRGGPIDGAGARLLYAGDKMKDWASAAWDGAKAAGSFIGNFTKDAVRKLADFAKAVGTAAWNAMKNLAAATWDAARAAAAQLAQWVAAAAAAVARVAVIAAQAVAQWAVTAATWAWSGAQWALNAALDANPIGLLVLAVAALVGGLIWAYTHSETFRRIVKDALDAVKKAGQAVLDFFRDHWPLLLSLLAGPIGLAVYEIVKHWDSIKEAVSNFISTVMGWFGDRWAQIKGLLSGPISDAKNAIVGFFSDIWTGGRAKLNSLIDHIAGLPGRAKEALSKLGQFMKDGVNGGLKTVFDFIDRYLIGNLNKIITKFHIPAIPAINYQPYSEGGIVPGGYRPRQDIVPAILSPGEGILVPEATRALGGLPAITAINRWARGGGGVPGFADGGVLGRIGRGIQTGAVNVGRFGRNLVVGTVNPALDFLTGVGEEIEQNLARGAGYALTHLLDPMISAMRTGFDEGFVADTVVGAMQSLRDNADKWGRETEAAAAPAMGGAAGSAVLRNWIATAIGYAGVPASWIGPMTTLVMRESGGNPRSINLTDSNARAGHPSQGLAQTIPSTFAQYRDHRLPNDILDPVANLVASMNYIKAIYGDISRVQQANPNMPPKGYDAGGILGHGEIGINRTRRPERVLSPQQTEAFDRLVNALERGGGGGRAMTVNVAVQPGQRRLGWEVGDAVANTAILNGWV